MTNKDTERLVRQAMQQTIPDKEALWAKIEADLPAQPEFSRIRRHPGKMSVVYRVVGTAACFLLIVGSIGIVSSLTKTHLKNETATMSDSPRQEYAAPAADKQQNEMEAACDAGAEAPEELYDSENDGADLQSDLKNSGKAQQIAPSMAEEGAASVQNAEDHSEEIVVEHLIIHGAYADTEAHFSETILAAIAEELPPPESVLSEQVALDPVKNGGVYLALRYQEKRIILTALDGEYRMIVDGSTFSAPPAARELLESLEN